METQTVIITGASRGLGAAAARHAALLGAHLVLNARSAASLNRLSAEISNDGGQTLAVAGDISHPETCQHLVELALKKFGHLDALVNNAGVIEPIAPIGQWDPAAWRKSLTTNVLGAIWMTQAALPHLRKRHGRVINVSSGAAVKVIRGWSAYCTAKAALNHFNRALAAEESAITAIAFRPGVVDTAMQAVIREHGPAGMPEEEYARFVGYYHHGDLLPPELPGRALATLALFAPHEWSGDFLPWDDEKVKALVGRSI